MRILTIIGSAFVLAILAVIAAVVLGAVEPHILVLAAFFFVGACISFFIRHLFAGMEKQGAIARELPEKGIRRPGRVRDALPYAAAHGGVLFSEGGAQMVLQVELEAHAGLPAQTVTLIVIEPSEVSRARIGTNVVVLEHPVEHSYRALEGFLPNGVGIGTR